MSQTALDERFDGETDRKKRKIRKGTQSCWQCKTRKVRCTFAVLTDAVCDGCRRRGTKCISQEFPDEPAPAKRVEYRLGRVEEMVELLARKPNENTGLGDVPPSTRTSSMVSKQARPDSSAVEAAPETSAMIPDPSLEKITNSNDLSSHLIAAWPSQRDLDHILSLSANKLGLLTGSTCALYTSLPGSASPSPRDILQLPPIGSHPILIARKLLLLGSYLQRVQKLPAQKVNDSSVSSLDSTMSRIVDTCHNLATSNDDLVESAEGIECIMIESMYHNNAGNLRRSWLATRRAILIAQLIGLHRDLESAAPMNMLQPDPDQPISRGTVWFRLVQVDRYLSLMLGLPLGYAGNGFAERRLLERCTPLERMHRLHAVAIGHILQRDHTGTDDLASVHGIEALLHEASSLMPSKWWTPSGGPGDNEEGPHGIVQILSLFTHFHMLARLHLPYLMRSSSDSKYDYSKITAVNASREVISWFVSCRASNPTVAYCRGMDFMFFIASTTLCIAHIEARRQHRTPGSAQHGSVGYGVFDFLVHQRLPDRSMMERALDCLHAMARDGTDQVASKIANILCHLLAIESDAAAGGFYNTQSTCEESLGRDEELGFNGNLDENGKLLHIFIPYFGTITIERNGVSKSAVKASEKPISDLPLRVNTWIPHQHWDKSQQQPTRTPAAYQFASKPTSPGWQVVPSHSPLPTRTEISQKNLDDKNGSASLDMYTPHDQQLFVPGLEVPIDEWALQGVDTAFFDSLLWGANEDGSQNISPQHTTA